MAFAMARPVAVGGRSVAAPQVVLDRPRATTRGLSKQSALAKNERRQRGLDEVRIVES